MAQRSRPGRANVLVYGSNGVGKTALIVRFITKRFIGEYDQNKETLYTYRVPATTGGGGGGEMVLDILDPAQSTDGAQLDSHMRWADGFLLVYSVTDRSSFDHLDHVLDLIRTLRPPDESTPLVVVANKTDCPGFARRVATSEALSLGRRHSRPVYELSVAEGGPEAAAEAWDDLIGQLKREQVRVGRGQPATNQRSPFTNVKRVLKERIYNRSRSDTTMSVGQQRSPTV